MTSLFRRSSSSNGGSRSGGGGGGGDGEGGPLNNSRPNRQVRRLEFNQAMEDFKTMFPSMDYEVIECVLRSNNGAVDATIDQLLQMSIDGQGSDDSSDSDDSIPPEILERTLEPDSSDEEPPPVYSPPAYDMHIYDRKYPEAPPTPPPRFEAEPLPAHTQARSYRNWNPPLLGNLPDDFLRILPQQLDSIKSSQSSLSQPSSSSSSSVSSISQWTTHSSSQPGGAGTAGGPGLPAGATEQDKKLKQYLEDERIALFLQNEEFMRELQRNREFLIALERDRLKYESKRSKSTHSSSLESSTGDQCSATSTEAVSDDALFQDKLKHMGKSTRKKLFEIARTFSEKTKRRKSKRKVLLKHHSYPPEPCSPRSLYATAALLFLNGAPPQAGHRRLHRQPPGRRRGERRRRRRPAETSRHSGSEGAGRRAGIMILPLHHIRVPMASRPTCAGGSLSPPTPDL